MKSLIETYKEDLEVVLDAGFPKVEEEGPEKIAMKRGPALALFAEAVVRTRKIIQAFGGCEKCYGKGYGTETLYTEGGYGSRAFRDKLPSMNLCDCARGKQLGDVIEQDLGIKKAEA